MYLPVLVVSTLLSCNLLAWHDYLRHCSGSNISFVPSFMLFELPLPSRSSSPAFLSAHFSHLVTNHLHHVYKVQQPINQSSTVVVPWCNAWFLFLQGMLGKLQVAVLLLDFPWSCIDANTHSMFWHMDCSLNYYLHYLPLVFCWFVSPPPLPLPSAFLTRLLLFCPCFPSVGPNRLPKYILGNESFLSLFLPSQHLVSLCSPHLSLPNCWHGMKIPNYSIFLF